MLIHKVLKKKIKMPEGENVEIKYWADDTNVYVAAFDESDQQVSVGTYSADVDIADGFDDSFHQPLIDGLVEQLENDLRVNPEMHYKN